MPYIGSLLMGKPQLLAGDIADDAITLAKMASGTDGNIITYDASGDPAAVSTGSSGQLLTSAGSGSPPTFSTVTASSGWEFISRTVFSDSATFTATVESGYDYQGIFRDVLPASDSQIFAIEVGVAGPTYRTSGYLVQLRWSNSSNQHGASTATAYLNFGTHGQGYSASEHMSACATIFDPAGSGFTAYEICSTYEGSSGIGYSYIGAGRYMTAESNTLLKFAYASGNITSGSLSFYRRAIS